MNPNTTTVTKQGVREYMAVITASDCRAFYGCGATKKEAIYNTKWKVSRYESDKRIIEARCK